MKQLLTSLRVFFLIMIFAAACSKKGDPGTNGTNGQNGTNGTNGANGATGNTLYISDTVHLVASDYGNGYWATSTEGGGTLGAGAKVATIAVDSITQSIYESGVVLVYMKNTSNFSTPNQWTQLPFQIGAFSGGYLINITTGFGVGEIKIYYFFTVTDASATVPNIFSTNVPANDFRYVIIPGRAGFGMSAPAKFIDEASMKSYFHVK